MTEREPPPYLSPARTVLSVSAFARQARQLLEGSFPRVWVEGEISNLARPASGHLYFTLKDSAAQLRCALFRGRGSAPPALRNGQQVLVRGRVSLYEPRGDFQLIVDAVEDAGEGALRRAYEALHQRLQAEGLFEPERKRPLPAWPRRIGVITSPSGAAIHDVLSVLRRRYPVLAVRVYPVPVQGSEAAAAVCAALASAQRHADCDLVLITRGGGSLEDLWPFNDEALARAIADCPIPVVSAVGHETDFTIADFVADRRAPTPSAAAELITPDGAALRRRLAQLRQTLERNLAQRLARHGQTLTSLGRRLEAQHPGRRLQRDAQRLDELSRRLGEAQRRRLRDGRLQLQGLERRLRAQRPTLRLARAHERLRALGARLRAATLLELERRRHRFTSAARTLHTVSPLQTLARGYAVVRTADTGAVLTHASAAPPGTRIEALLADGRLLATVDANPAAED